MAEQNNNYYIGDAPANEAIFTHAQTIDKKNGY